MTGFCDGCFVPDLLERLKGHPDGGIFWSDPETSKAAAALILSMAKHDECTTGVQLDPDNFMDFAQCQHPLAIDIGQIASALDGGSTNNDSAVTVEIRSTRLN